MGNFTKPLKVINMGFYYDAKKVQAKLALLVKVLVVRPVKVVLQVKVVNLVKVLVVLPVKVVNLVKVLVVLRLQDLVHNKVQCWSFFLLFNHPLLHLKESKGKVVLLVLLAKVVLLVKMVLLVLPLKLLKRPSHQKIKWTDSIITRAFTTTTTTDFTTTNNRKDSIMSSLKDSTTNRNPKAFIITKNLKDFITKKNQADFTTRRNRKDFTTDLLVANCLLSTSS